MRTHRSSIGILLLAFLVSGWGSVFAASFCPHASPEEHSCCAAKVEAANEPRAASAHCEMRMDEAEVTPATKPTVTPIAVAALGQSVESSCAHCMSRSEIPPPLCVTAASNPAQSKSSGDTFATHATTPIPPIHVFFSPPVRARQSAPPLNSSARHVLINVFRI